MESKKTGWLWIFGGMLVFGAIVEAIRIGLFKAIAAFPEQMIFSITDDHVIWNTFDGLKPLGYVADSLGAGIGLALIIALFTDDKVVTRGSRNQAIIGSVVGTLVAMVMLPGATLAQMVLLAVGLGICFGAALGSEFISVAELFGVFGMMLGMTLWTFFLYGGLIALLAMVSMTTTNIIGVFIGYLIGCSGAALGRRLATRKKT